MSADQITWWCEVVLLSLLLWSGIIQPRLLYPDLIWVFCLASTIWVQYWINIIRLIIVFFTFFSIFTVAYKNGTLHLFFLCLSYISVGLGNVIRFPTLIFETRQFLCTQLFLHIWFLSIFSKQNCVKPYMYLNNNMSSNNNWKQIYPKTSPYWLFIAY